MASNLEKWGIGLLAGVLALQGWVLIRQTQLRDQIQASTQRMEELSSLSSARVSNLEFMMQTRDTLPQWLSKPVVTVTPDPECRSDQVKVAWGLTDWTPGTKARLQYRRGTGEEWQEAVAVDHGQQSYEATFDLSGGPGLLWRVTASRTGVTGATTTQSPGVVYYPPDTAQYRSGNPAMPAIQYRIVVDVPGGSRATAPQAIPLGPDLTAAASFTVTADEQRNYSVAAFVDPSPRNACVQVRSVVVRPMAGEKAMGEYPLAAGQQGTDLTAAWKSDVDLTRVDIVVRYGIHENVIPVDVPAR